MQFVSCGGVVVAESRFGRGQGLGERLSQLRQANAPCRLNTENRATNSAVLNM